MPATIPANLMLEKNKVESQNAWVLLIEFQYNSTVFRYTNDNEQVIYGGQTYESIAFKFGAMSTSDDGKINSVNLQLSNISRAMFTFAEDTNGLIDVPVVVRLVNTGHLTEDYTNLTLNFTIIGTSVDQEWLTFTLGGPNPLRRRFPQDKYVALYCNWAYKSAECNYTGGLATCKRTKADCASHNNLANFGGYPGLRPDGIRVL